MVVATSLATTVGLSHLEVTAERRVAPEVHIPYAAKMLGRATTAVAVARRLAAAEESQAQALRVSAPNLKAVMETGEHPMDADCMVKVAGPTVVMVTEHVETEEAAVAAGTVVAAVVVAAMVTREVEEEVHHIQLPKTPRTPSRS